MSIVYMLYIAYYFKVDFVTKNNKQSQSVLKRITWCIVTYSVIKNILLIFSQKFVCLYTVS